MRCRAAGGMTAQPTRSPVAAKLFDAASSRMEYGATSGHTSGGVAWRALPNVSCQ